MDRLAVKHDVRHRRPVSVWPTIFDFTQAFRFAVADANWGFLQSGDRVDA